MNRKRRMRTNTGIRSKVVILLLVCCLFIGSFSGNALAADDDYQVKYLLVYATAVKEELLLELISDEDHLYLSSEDCATVSGFKQKESETDIYYQKGENLVFPKTRSKTFHGKNYYEFNGILNELSVLCSVDEKGDVVLKHTTYFLDDLRNYVKENKIYPHYSLKQMADTPGMFLADLYNILGGLRLDFVTGNYQTEQYETAFFGILDSSEDSKVLSTLKKGNKTINDLIKIGKVGGMEVREFLGYPYDDYLSAYNEVNNNKLMGDSIGTVLDIAEHLYQAVNASELFVNSVKRGISEDPKNNHMKKARENVLAYYSDNFAGYKKILDKALGDVLEEKAEDVFKEAMLSELNIAINSKVVKLFKLALDKIWMEKPAKAASQTVVCHKIQREAKKNASNAVINAVEHGDKAAAVDYKYSILLYLRAEEYAFSLYEFDEDLAPYVKINRENIQAVISDVAAYDDAELGVEIDNRYENSDLPLMNQKDVPKQVVKKSKELLEQGGMKMALSLLTKEYRKNHDKELEKGLNAFWERVSISYTRNPEKMSSKFNFNDQKAAEDRLDVGLVLYDQETGNKEQIAVFWCDQNAIDDTLDLRLLGKKNDTVLIDFVGVSYHFSSLYSIVDNGWADLNSSSEILFQDGDKFVGITQRYGIPGNVIVSVFDWTGNCLDSLESCSEYIQDTTLYYLTFKEKTDDSDMVNTIVVHKKDLNQLTDEQTVCTIRFEGSIAYLEDGYIYWESVDGVKDKMALKKAHDMDAVGKNKTKVQVDKEKLAKRIVKHYMKKIKPSGNYVIFTDHEADCVETDETISFVVRYQMSEEDAQDRFERGLSVAANVYAFDVTVDKKTGAVTSSSGDSWQVKLD